MAGELLPQLGPVRVIPAWAAGGVAAAAYSRAPGESVFRPTSLHVLGWRGDRVAEVHAFVDPRLFGRFGMPSTLG